MKKRLIIPVVIVLAAALGGGYWWLTGGREVVLSATAGTANTPADIFGSGTIETDQIAIAAQLGGRVIAVQVSEGDSVTAGQTLIQLDTTDFLAQQAQMLAGVDMAQANLAEVKSGPRPVDVAVSQATLEQAKASAGAAEAIWQQARRLVDNPQDLQIQLDGLKGQLAVAEDEVEMAQTELKLAQIERDEAMRNQSDDAALTQQQISQKKVEAADIAVGLAEAKRDGLQSQVEQLQAMVAFPVQLIVQANQTHASTQLAWAAVDVARANLVVTSAGPRPEDVQAAEDQLQQAQAALHKMDVYLDLQTLTAPQAGIVSQKSIYVGELATPGAVLMNLENLDQVKLTVYIPETQIGRVQEGQTARVNVDAYPNQIFEGRVIYIAPQAEFTPKNVQTKESRVNLVFAVKILLDNPEHLLKPGMPADATILSDL